jgi:hypothetical protein
VGETLLQVIDEGNDLIASLNRKRATGAEIVLQIDDEEGVIGLERHGIYFFTAKRR